ncbi:hypothetical protein [Ochrobactrum sp. A-1]|uniref:hypothetical protein n=1 Tax=Ochrobactrum sp. A-1 TaxID=2920940 RepID=UPI001F0AEAA8|nr:hypothetical protein [Ochrobactrum sp. A-1]
MSITITISGNTANDVQEHLRQLLNGTVGGTLIVQPVENQNVVTDEWLASQGKDDTAAAPVKRERGKPAPGRARRTKEEIAEDEAADAADAKLSEEATDAGIQSDTGKDVKAAISTGESRVGPEDDPETEAQDAADEKAEAEANRKGLTLDDVRHAVGAYNKKFGMAAAVADIPSILGCAIVEVPEDGIADAIAKIEEAVNLNPMGRDIVGAEKSKAEPAKNEPGATLDDVKSAMLDYAEKFDGQRTDFNKMPNTMADCPAIFKLIFGDKVTKLSEIPADGEAYAKAVSGIREAIAKDPFKRGAK